MKLSEEKILINKIVLIVDKTKNQVTSYANILLTTLFWQIGHAIKTNTLDNQKANYEKKLSFQSHEYW